MGKETDEEKLAQLQQELEDLKAKLPEHCSGTDTYVSVHRASPAHWQKIEDVEEAIRKLKSNSGR